MALVNEHSIIKHDVLFSKAHACVSAFDSI